MTDESTLIVDLLDSLEVFATSPAVSVAWPNKNYTRQLGQPFLNVAILGGTSGRPGMPDDSVQFLEGMLQISVMWPANRDTVQAHEEAVRIKQHFARGSQHGSARIGAISGGIGEPQIGPALDEPNWHQVPVTVPYYAFAQ